MHKLFLGLALIALLTGCGPKTTPPTAPTAPAHVYRSERPTLRYDPQDLTEAENVEYIGLRMAGQKNLTSQPLWGDRDPEAVAHILAILRTAEPAQNPRGVPQHEGPAGTHLVVHYRDGHETWVSYAYENRGQGVQHWGEPYNYWVSGKGEVRSDALDMLMRTDRFAFIPPVSTLTVTPPETTGGGEITITGRGWVGGKTASIRLADGGVVLGEAPVERGEFTWTGKLPEKLTVPPWLHVGIKVAVDGVGEGVTSVKVDLSKGKK